MGRGLDRAGGPREEERPRLGAGVDRAADAVPEGRHPLPLVEEDGAVPFEEPIRRGLRDRPLGRVVEAVDGGRPLERRLRLPDPFGPLDGDRGEGGDELVQLGVDDAAEVRHGRGGS